MGLNDGGEIQNWTTADIEREFTDYNTIHARWLRSGFDWDAIEPTQGTYRWSGFDNWVKIARAKGIEIIATIGYTPAWANGGHSDHNYEPTDPKQFGGFAGEVAGRYASKGVHVYEIWNEPNIGFWKPVPDPARYTADLCAAYTKIHDKDPKAVVLTGGSSPAGNGSTSYDPQTWLEDLYADGAGGCFDGVAHHPYVDGSNTPGDLGGGWTAMSEYSGYNLRQIMVAHGDSDKRIWATEVGCNRAALGDAECSARIAEAFGLWQSYPWAGVLCWFTYWDPNVYGLVDEHWAHRPEWTAYRNAAAAFP